MMVIGEPAVDILAVQFATEACLYSCRYLHACRKNRETDRHGCCWSQSTAYDRDWEEDLGRSGLTTSRSGLNCHRVKLFGSHKTVLHGARLYLAPTVSNQRSRRRMRVILSTCMLSDQCNKLDW